MQSGGALVHPVHRTFPRHAYEYVPAVGSHINERKGQTGAGLPYARASRLEVAGWTTWPRASKQAILSFAL